MNTAIKVGLTVVIDLHQWAEEYDLPLDEVRDDIRAAAAIVFQDWLIENLGYRGASVRVASTVGNW